MEEESFEWDVSSDSDIDEPVYRNNPLDQDNILRNIQFAKAKILTSFHEPDKTEYITKIQKKFRQFLSIATYKDHQVCIFQEFISHCATLIQKCFRGYSTRKKIKRDSIQNTGILLRRSLDSPKKPQLLCFKHDNLAKKYQTHIARGKNHRQEIKVKTIKLLELIKRKDDFEKIEGIITQQLHKRIHPPFKVRLKPSYVQKTTNSLEKIEQGLIIDIAKSKRRILYFQDSVIPKAQHIQGNIKQLKNYYNQLIL